MSLPTSGNSLRVDMKKRQGTVTALTMYDFRMLMDFIHFIGWRPPKTVTSMRQACRGDPLLAVHLSRVSSCLDFCCRKKVVALMRCSPANGTIGRKVLFVATATAAASCTANRGSVATPIAERTSF
jgi:hypothetical protein